MMTVAELIAALQELNPAADVGTHSNSLYHDIDYIDAAVLAHRDVVILPIADDEDEDA